MPEEAREKIDFQRRAESIAEPCNLEEQAISLVGKDIYERLIKGYTEKQWGRPCKELPAFIIRRLPVRFSYDNNYFDAMYQGIPVDGYTVMIAKMLEGVDVRLNVDFLCDRLELEKLARHIVFMGQIDSWFDYETTFTRCIEHKYFYPGLVTASTVITHEYPSEWKIGDEPYYPVNNERNTALY